MKPNVGSTDRAIRIVAGIALLSLAFIGPRTAWGYLGLVPLLTGLVRWCPLYTLLHLSTRSTSTPGEARS